MLRTGIWNIPTKSCTYPWSLRLPPVQFTKMMVASLVSASATRAVYQSLCQVSAPELSRTSTGICTGTLQNLTRYLHRNPPEPHQVSAPEPSGTSTGHLHRNPFGTLRNFARNLLLKLHRIAPELIWAKDPIAKFCQWEKRSWIVVLVLSRNSTTVLHCITPMSWPRCF